MDNLVISNSIELKQLKNMAIGVVETGLRGRSRFLLNLPRGCVEGDQIRVACFYHEPPLSEYEIPLILSDLRAQGFDPVELCLDYNHPDWRQWGVRYRWEGDEKEKGFWDGVVGLA